MSIFTEKLYYEDSHRFRFTAKVLACRAAEGGYRILLDRSAFFPEGGGQSADTGSIGEVRVVDVQEREGEILHYTLEPLTEGEEYACRLDEEQRLRRMQNHSGEHILSGTLHTLYGVDNVGFHMGSDCMTIDLSGELSPEQLERAETLANEAVRADTEVRVWFPEPEELEKLEYRSKLDLKENVRIVELGGDRCACCAPHVKRTGEIGLIQILDSVRHRGGTRLSVVCGMDALDVLKSYRQNIAAISGLLSARREETAAAVERVLREQQEAKERTGALNAYAVELLAERYARQEGNLCIFNSLLNDHAARELINRLTPGRTGLVAVFSGEEGSYRYIIGSENVDLRACAKDLNAGIGGRGGGKPEMIQGSCTADRVQIRSFLEGFSAD